MSQPQQLKYIKAYVLLRLAKHFAEQSVSQMDRVATLIPIRSEALRAYPRNTIKSMIDDHHSSISKHLEHMRVELDNPDAVDSWFDSYILQKEYQVNIHDTIIDELEAEFT